MLRTPSPTLNPDPASFSSEHSQLPEFSGYAVGKTLSSSADSSPEEEQPNLISGSPDISPRNISYSVDLSTGNLNSGNNNDVRNESDEVIFSRAVIFDLNNRRGGDDSYLEEQSQEEEKSHNDSQPFKNEALDDTHLTVPLLGEQSNDKKPWPTSFRQLPLKFKVPLVAWAIITAIQTTLNSFSVSHNIMFEEDANCAVGEFDCYSHSAWRDWRSFFVLYFIMSTFTLNIMIFLYYGPKAFARMFTWETWKTWKGYVAALLASGASLVGYKQGIDALTLFSHFLAGTSDGETSGKALDIIMLTAAVSSTFCTREEGAFNIIELCQLRYYSFYLDRIPHLLNDVAKQEYEKRRFALSVKDALYAYEYDLTVEQRRTLLVELKALFEDSVEQTAVTLDLTTLMTRPNRGGYEYVYQGVYWLAKAVFLFFAVVSYEIIYNIVKITFPGIAWKYFTPVVALASPIFYLSTLGRMPDAESRVFKKMMFYDAKTPQEQIKNFGIYIVTRLWILGSCGNFLYSAWDQVKNGQVNRLSHYLHMSRLAATAFWANDGADISLFVNWFAASNIYVEETDDPDLYKASQEVQKYIKDAILQGGVPLNKIYTANNTQTVFSANTYNPLRQLEEGNDTQDSRVVFTANEVRLD